MANIKLMRDKMAKLAADARAKLDEITDKTSEDRAKEISTEFDVMMTEHAGLSERLDRDLKLEEIDRRAREVDLTRRPDNGQDLAPQDDDAPTYRDAFTQYIRSGGSLGEMAPEMRAVLISGQEKRALTSGTNSQGGFSVPDEAMGALVRSMLAWGPMYNEDICTVITTTGGASWPIPTVNDTAVTAGAHTEGATMTDDGGKDVVFGQKTLDAFEFDTEWVGISKALLDDSALAVETLLMDLLGERLGRLANLQLTTGTGSGAPNGIVTATTAGKTAAATGAITADEILDFIHSVDPAYRASPKSRIMFNDTTLLALQKLKDGQGNYLITELPDGSGRLRVGAVSVPYSINQSMPSMATGTKPITYGDFGKYYVRKVGAPLLMSARDTKFLPGVGVAGYIRFDGELVDAAAVKHLVMA